MMDGRNLDVRIRAWRLIATSLLLFLLSATVFAAPKDDLFNDDKLAAAGRDIFKMEYAELSSLSRYFAACNNAGLSDNDILRYQCSFAGTLYTIEFESGRPINDLISTLNIVREALRLNRENKMPDRAEIFKRYLDVEQSLLKYTTIRFHDLRQKAREMSQGNSQR